MIRGVTLVFLLFFTVALVRAQQAASCLERAIPVSVASNDGSPAPELTAASLEGVYDKKKVTVESAELERNPPRVILLVDTSGSMQARIDATIDVTEGVLLALPENIETGLAFFAEDEIPVVPLTGNRKELVTQLEALRRSSKSYRGKTALWSALNESTRMFKTPHIGDAIYLVSDGGENKSVETERNVIASLERAGIRLFAFVLASNSVRGRSAEELTGPAEVERLVSATGGTAIVTSEPDGPYPARVSFLGKNGEATHLGESLLAQLAQLLKFYRVEITLPEMVDKSRDWKLRVSKNGLSQGGLRLTYPVTLWPCS